MKSVFLGLYFSLICVFSLFATHQRAAQITYRHVEGLTFSFKIVMYTRTSSPADNTRTYMPIQWGDGNADELERNEFYPLPGETDISYMEYNGQHTFPAPGSYVISVEDPNRNNGVLNIPNSVNVPMYTETELFINPFLGINNSVQLLNPPIDQGCVGKTYIHNPGAYDIDGDSLSYELVVCKAAGGRDIPGYTYPKTPPNGFFGMSPYTGELVWETPILQGEVNVAFVVTEWRHGVKIGSVRRDMQINIVTCDHEPPEIYAIDDTCVVAGDFLQFDVLAIDPDGTNVELTGFGGPFEQSNSPARIIPDPATGNDTVVTTFQWNTNCSHVRLEPYTAVFKARDDGYPVNLVNFKTVFIQVIGPPPENLTAEALGNGINLKWDSSPCANAVGYNIYRRNGESGWDPDYCEYGVPASTGFRLIGTVDDINNIEYRDENEGLGLVHGTNYCYRVTARFIDEAESKASNEACAHLKRDVPIITHVSNDSLNLISGHVILAWSKPTELDTVKYPGPYKYVVYRNNGLGWNSPQKIAELNGLNDTIYYDDQVNLNTNNGPYMYQIDLESLSVGFVGSSQRASSLYIRFDPTDQELKMSWAPVVPWVNDKFIIYRKGPGENDFDSLDLTLLPLYRDRGLKNDVEYCYFIKASGHYSLPGLADPLINFSQIGCAEPTDNKPPCPPVIAIDSTYCELVQNELKMIIPLDTCAKYDVFDYPDFCDCNAVKYNIYFTQNIEDDFQLVGSVDYLYNDTVYYLHNELNFVVGCYIVTAVDDVGNESKFSNMVCVDYDACPIYELPNVFTPNNDGKNDLFVPMGTGEDGSAANPNIERVDMTIFNRWGKIMYTTDDPQINWDGINQTNNQECSDGVYFYTCTVYVVTLTGIDQFNMKGSVTIFRGR